MWTSQVAFRILNGVIDVEKLYHILFLESRRILGANGHIILWYGLGYSDFEYAATLSIPGYSFADHHRKVTGKDLLAYTRPTRRETANYYCVSAGCVYRQCSSM